MWFAATPRNFKWKKNEVLQFMIKKAVKISSKHDLSVDDYVAKVPLSLFPN